MGWMFFLAVMIVFVIMLFLLGIKAIISILGFLSFLSLIYGCVCLVVFIVKKNSPKRSLFAILGVGFLAFGIAILAIYCITSVGSGNSIDLVEFFIPGL